MVRTRTDCGDQSEVVAFLRAPQTHGGERAQHIETHLSHVVLTPSRAYKLKKAMRWSVVDYGTRDKREHYCRRELEVNAPFAGALYVGVRTITRRGDTLEFDGPGEAVDHVVEMRRFADGAQLDQMVENGTLTAAIVEQTADVIAAMHKAVPRVVATDRSQAEVQRVDQLFEDVRAACERRHRETTERWVHLARQEIERVRRQLDARGRHGFVRRCHGDLHLSNICLYEGRPTPFDAIEFSEELATIDIAYDFAFVLVDLELRGRADLSARLLSRYLEWTRDYRALRLLPLYRSERAMVRALVGLAKGRDPGPAIALATAAITERPAPFLVGVGGLSGTGKSTLARALCEATGALVLRSDARRKHLHRIPPEERLPAEGYSETVSAKVHAVLWRDAARAVGAGVPVIIDATFLREEVRQDFLQLGERLGVPTTGLWLEVPEEVARKRVAARSGDASDATEAVLAAQMTQPTGPIAFERLDASADFGALVARVLARLPAATRPDAVDP